MIYESSDAIVISHLYTFLCSRCLKPGDGEDEVTVDVVKPGEDKEPVPPFEFDPEFEQPVPQWPDDETKEKAQKECEDLINCSPIGHLCPDLPREDAIGTCVEDAQVSHNLYLMNVTPVFSLMTNII